MEGSIKTATCHDCGNADARYWDEGVYYCDQDEREHVAAFRHQVRAEFYPILRAFLADTMGGNAR